MSAGLERERNAMRQTVKNIAAIKLAAAEDAMWPAGAAALDDVGSDEAKTHAKETRGAKVVRSWEWALWRIHRTAAGNVKKR